MAEPKEPSVRLTSDFADAMPEMAVAWRAKEMPAPELVVLNDALATELGLDPGWLRTPAGIAFLLGQAGDDVYHPVAQAYSGHQFGQFTPVLGDGRALLLGEIAGPDGTVRDIALKGSGPTPFARRGDGLAALGPMLREYLVSEAMHALGIPTTRSLAVIATGGRVVRERALPGAVLVRVAASHLRVGSFQFARVHGGVDVVKRLTDHALARHHRPPPGLPGSERARALFDAVAAAQAELIPAWQGVGFVHGVMNTDNVTISGETIDYGPCAFLDAHDPRTVFSSIDHAGVYAYGNQPAVLEWDLARLAECLVPLYDADPDAAVAIAEEQLSGFRASMDDRLRKMWRRKLGIGAAADDVAAAAVVDEWLALLAAATPDHTLAQRALTDVAAAAASGAGGDAGHARARLLAHLGDGGGADGGDGGRAREWLRAWLALSPDAAAMAAANPIHVPRNHLVEEALAAAGSHAAGDPRDMAPFHALLARVTDPYAPSDNPDDERYGQPAPAEFGRYTTYCGT